MSSFTPVVTRSTSPTLPDFPLGLLGPPFPPPLLPIVFFSSAMIQSRFLCCHSVSNDAMPCQAFCGDTSAATPKEAPFRSRRMHFDVQTKVVTLFNPAAGHQVPPSISSGLAPTITHFDLPDCSGRQAAHSNARL